MTTKPKGPAWQPLVFLVALMAQIGAYEVWASKHKGYTISEFCRFLGAHWRWIATLVLILNGFFFLHCWGKPLGVID